MAKYNDVRDLGALIEKISISDACKRVVLTNPLPFLELLNTAPGKRILVDDFEFLQPWAIAALAARALTDYDDPKIYVQSQGTTPPAKFAHALGLDDIIAGHRVGGEPEEGRTVKLRRLNDFNAIEQTSSEISHLVVSDGGDKNNDLYFDVEETRKTIYYVMIELLRNVMQHSYDDKGAIIVAQRMDRENNIQIAVVDCGVGIYETLKTTHVDIINAKVALERSIWPHYSGKFFSGQKGSGQNAGLGLFFVSEMAKLTSGKVLISSRGASLFIQGDPEALGDNKIQEFDCGFEGTLVAFEMPKRGIGDYDALIKRIQEKLRERESTKQNIQWINYDEPPIDAVEFSVSIASENTVMAETFSETELIPRIKNYEILILNFRNMQICTQSYMHALLFNALQTAYRLRVPIYVKGASPSIKDGLKLLEGYAL